MGGPNCMIGATIASFRAKASRRSLFMNPFGKCTWEQGDGTVSP